MSENNQQVPPVSGHPAPPPSAPPTIPPARRAFRRTDNSNFNAVVTMPVVYSKDTGIPPIVGATQGYNFHENTDHTPSTFVPSFITLIVTWYLTCQRFSGHDRFLRDTSSWHPYFDLLYLSFIMMYHIIRVRRRFGYLDTYEQQFLAELETRYPPSSLHIPGTYVAILQSITATESPYPWQGLIGATLPAEISALTGKNCYLHPNNIDKVFVNPLIALSLLDEVVKTTRTDAHAPVIIGLQTYLGAEIKLGVPARAVLNTPYARTSNPSSPRSEHLFWTNFSGPDVTTTYANFNRNWDLPRRPSLPSESDVPLTLPQAMCIVDPPGSASRTDRYRNWPNQYSSVMALMCQYTKGSRSLNDISEAGLGASIPIWQYAINVLDTSDPDTFLKGPLDDRTLDLQSCRNAKTVTTLAANAISQDPEGSQLAAQYSAISQVNVQFPASPSLPTFSSMHSGPFWHTPVCELGSPYDPTRLLSTAINGSISSVNI